LGNAHGAGVIALFGRPLAGAYTDTPWSPRVQSVVCLTLPLG
jgi:hypothetical protein